MWLLKIVALQELVKSDVNNIKVNSDLLMFFSCTNQIDFVKISNLLAAFIESFETLQIRVEKILYKYSLA